MLRNQVCLFNNYITWMLKNLVSNDKVPNFTILPPFSVRPPPVLHSTGAFVQIILIAKISRLSCIK